MALNQSLTEVDLPAAADLSANQYRFLDVDANGRAAVPTVAGSNGPGIQQNDPAALDRPTSVAIAGVSKCIAGAAVAAGAKVSTDNQGRGITAVATHHVRGQAFTAASAAGELFEVQLGSLMLLP